MIIRYLGPSQFGLLSYALSFVGLFSAIASLGLDGIVVRELVRNPEKRDVLLGTVFYLRLTGAIIAFGLIALTAYLMGEARSTFIIILIISTSTFFQSLFVIDFYFQSRVLARYSAIVQFSSILITSIIKILLIITEAGLIYFAAVTALEYLIIGIIYLVVYKFSGVKFSSWIYSKNVSLQLLGDSWPLILSGIAIAVYMKIDQVMLRNMLNEQQVGYYAAAVRLTEAWYFIPMAIVTSLFPAILNAKKVNEALYINRLQKLYDLLVLFAVIIALPVTIFSELIIQILLGLEYISSASVLTVYIWGSIAVFLGVASNQYLIAENYTKISFYRTLAGVVLNVILNLILIPVLGIMGSAIATLISYTLSVLSISLNKKTSYQFTMMIRAIFLINIFNLFYKKLTGYK